MESEARIDDARALRRGVTRRRSMEAEACAIEWVHRGLRMRLGPARRSHDDVDRGLLSVGGCGGWGESCCPKTAAADGGRLLLMSTALATHPFGSSCRPSRHDAEGTFKWKWAWLGVEIHPPAHCGCDGVPCSASVHMVLIDAHGWCRRGRLNEAGSTQSHPGHPIQSRSQTHSTRTPTTPPQARQAGMTLPPAQHRRRGALLLPLALVLLAVESASAFVGVAPRRQQQLQQQAAAARGRRGSPLRMLDDEVNPEVSWEEMSVFPSVLLA